MTGIWDVVINLISDVIWLASGAFLVLSWRFFARRLNLFVRFTGLFPGKDRCLLSYGLIPPHTGAKHPYYSIEEGDVRALTVISASLTRRLSDRQVSLLSHFDIEGFLDSSDCIVSLSGPLYNSATELLIGATGSPVTFDRASRAMVVSKDDAETRYFTKVLPNGRPEECYGMILRSKRKTQSQRDQNVIIIAGLSNLSTYGCARIFSDLDKYLLSNVGFFRALFTRWKSYAVICKVVNSSVNAADTGTLPFRSEMLSLSIVDICRGPLFKSPFTYRF